jgi:hypothetical protein
MPDAAVPNYSEAGHGDINPSNGAAQDCELYSLALIFDAKHKRRIKTTGPARTGILLPSPNRHYADLASNSPIQSINQIA